MSQKRTPCTTKAKPCLYTGGDFDEPVLVTIKIDGVRMLRDSEGNPVSRGGNPLNNLQGIPKDIIDAEVFLGSWSSTVSAVRNSLPCKVEASCVYNLNPVDDRLIIGSYSSITEEEITALFDEQVAKGNEGLVIYTYSKAYKVKTKETYDVLVTGATQGKGKYTGLVGALVTEKGNVSGFTDEQRNAFTDKLPNIIEVDCMGLTPKGKFRHPRFVRERFDK